MIENSEIVKKIMKIGSVEEMKINILEHPMIGDFCTEMYHEVSKEKPVTSLANGVRIIMYLEEE
jgi:hypothetical protein